MIVKLRKRFYCEHCKKSGGSSYYMRRHEIGCTANPNRECGFCKSEVDIIQASMEVLRAAFRQDAANHEERHKHTDPWVYASSEVTIPLLRESANNCPACILSAIRQEQVICQVDFDFDKERLRWWEERGSNVKNLRG